MASTETRSFVKGLSWELFSFILTTIIVYLIYGNIIFSMKFSFVLSAIKILFFYTHERAWKKIRWGKYHIINGKKIEG